MRRRGGAHVDRQREWVFIFYLDALDEGAVERNVVEERGTQEYLIKGRWYVTE